MQKSPYRRNLKGILVRFGLIKLNRVLNFLKKSRAVQKKYIKNGKLERLFNFFNFPILTRPILKTPTKTNTYVIVYQGGVYVLVD